jgi:ketosteroid isomerase-like protein
MTTRLVVAAAIVLAWLAPALAEPTDPTAIASAHSAKFDKAIAACDVPAVMALYEDDAVAIYPGEGDVANGRPEIEKMVKRYCSGGPKPLPYKQTSAHARRLGRDYIIMVRMLDGADANSKPFRCRATELLHKSGGQWRYLVDHASFGMPLPPIGAPAKAKP